MRARNYLLLFFLCMLFGSIYGQISGTVFRDFNANGTKDNTASFNEIGLPGITVMAFNSAGAQVGGTQITNASGDYSFSGLTLPVRVEFSNLPSGYFSSASGATNVQFVIAPSNNVNFAAHNPYEYCQNQPKIATICYVSNAPNVPTSSETILWGDLSDFLSASPNTSGNFMPHNALASQAQTGSVYGMAYHKHTKQILVSTFAKMGTNIGPMGADGIYKLNPSNGTVTPFLNLSTIPGGASAGTITTPPVVGQIGKNGLGDLELSEDGTILYTINLANRRLYSIPIGEGASVPASIVGFDIPTPSGAIASDLAPFALAVKDGKVYIGMVNTAASSLSNTVDTYTDSNANGLRETNGTNFTFSNVALGVNQGEPFTDNDGNGIYNKGNAANLRAYVYEFDPSTSAFSLKLDFPLNYPRAFLVQNSGNYLTFAHSFIPWDDTQIQQLSSAFVPPSTIAVRYLEGQQPWLTDITFDGDDMVLGFRSRTADIVSSSSTTLGGEILRACSTGTNTWSIEFNGICGGVDQRPYPAVSVWANNTAPNTQGPGNGEWYWEDDGWEGEASQGSLSFIDGYSYVLTSMMDGLQNGGHQGFYGIDNTTGGVTGARNLFVGSPSNNMDPTAFGKSNGLGALEPICDLPPIEIGNRVWTDTDSDGIQDAGEAPISGVTVQLIQGTTVIGTATTDGNGNYYFSSAAGTNTASAIYGISQLDPNMTYIVRIPNVQGGSKQAALGTNSLTLANVGGAGQPDVRDSDGILVGNNAEVTVLTSDIGVAGANNHNFDFGFGAITCVTPTATAAVTNPTCAGSTAQSNGAITISGFTAGQRYQYSTGASFNSGAAVPASITAIPVGGVIVSNLANTSQQYTVRIYDATDNACFVDRTVNITAVICGACACKEFVYVNEPGGNIHKLEVNPTTAQLTEVGGINGIPWVNNPIDFPSPHGLGVDRNGFLFIGTNYGDPNSIRKLGCDGSLFPETGTTGFRAPVTGNWGYLLTNIQSYDGFVYANGVSNRIYKIDPCTGNTIGYIVLGNDFSNDWGLYIDKNGKFYATQPTGKIFVFTPVASDFTSNTVFPFLIDLGSNPTYGGLSPQYSGTGLQGIVTDNVGNIYVVEGDRDSGGTPSRLLKFSSTGTFIAAGPVDNLNNGAGWCQMAGIVYSETSGKLYTTSLDPGEDCVFIWNTNLTPVGAAIGPVPTLSGQCKAIGILSECCPLVTQTINEVICSGGNGEKFSLQEIIDCGDGIVCEGQWQEISNNSNGAIIFDECDLTIIVNGTGCAEYRLSKTTPAGPGQQCGIFSITVIICTEVPSATVAGASGTCTGSTPNNDAVINITAATNATQAGISTGATYTGPAFNGVGTITITGGTAAFTGRMHNTQYTIRIFNGANDCYTDYTVTTPAVTCCALTVSCTPQPQTNCTSVNGSASVSVSGAIGTVTYVWSSGEMTSSISNKAAGTYTVTVTDGGVVGCTRSCQAVITSTTTLPTATCSKTDNTNCSAPNGTASVVTNGNQISWSTGANTPTITGLSNGTYTVTVTNTTTGCTNTCQAVVGSTTTLPTASCSSTDNTNCGAANGTATVTTNGNQISWSTGANTPTITGLSNGTYTVTLTNTTTGCTNTCQAVVGSTTTLPTANCSSTDNTNCGAANGTASVTTNGNQIAWSTGANTPTITGLSNGTYTVTVTNTTTGCTNTCQAVVNNSTTNPTCSITANNQPSCANLTGGSITVSPSPAGTYTYNWSDIGSGSATRTGLTGGTYTVTVTNTTTNCTGVCNVTLTTPNNCCNINAITAVNLECLDNGTPSKITDNRIRFSATVTNTNALLTGYNVTINGGTTISPTSGTYGVNTQFTLGPGTAGGGATFTITVTDSATPGCSQTFQVIDPGTCTPSTPECPPVQCGTATIQVNGN